MTNMLSAAWLALDALAIVALLRRRDRPTDAEAPYRHRSLRLTAELGRSDAYSHLT